MSRRPFFAIASFAWLAGCSPPVPENPTWVNDVEPILRANCFHCHGSEEVRSMRGTAAARWDVFDVEAFTPIMPAPWPPPMFPGAKEYPGRIWLQASDEPGIQNNIIFRMPPSPAARLSQWEREVLERWSKKPERGLRASNNKPTVRWLVKPTSFIVEDGDREQVLGKMTCGTGRTAVVAAIMRSGTHSMPAGAVPPCQFVLSDGQDTIPPFTLD